MLPKVLLRVRTYILSYLSFLLLPHCAREVIDELLEAIKNPDFDMIEEGDDDHEYEDDEDDEYEDEDEGHDEF